MVQQKRKDMDELLRISAKDAANRGSVFSFEEFRKIIMTRWTSEIECDFIEWISLRFTAVTLLLGALRTEQFQRFRAGGLKTIEWSLENTDKDGFASPAATSSYLRVKSRNGSRPFTVEETSCLTIACCCKGHHEPLKVDLNQKGELKQPVTGNELCWFGNFELLVSHIQDPEQMLLQRWNVRKKRFGKQNLGRRFVRSALSRFCQFVGVKNGKINNMWARKTFVQVGLKEMQLPAQTVMEVTGHRSEKQMRADYLDIFRIHI